MKKISKLLFAIGIVSSLMLTGCSLNNPAEKKPEGKYTANIENTEVSFEFNDNKAVFTSFNGSSRTSEFKMDGDKIIFTDGEASDAANMLDDGDDGSPVYDKENDKITIEGITFEKENK